MDKRVVIVTGGSGGIGEAISLGFARAGDIVVINYRSNAGRAEKTAQKINAAGGEAFTVQADISSTEDAEKLVTQVVSRYGRVDVLVNNAGIAKSGFLILMGEVAWDEVIDTNLKGVYNMSKAVLPHMFDKKSGCIVNVSSLSGVTGLAGEVPYSAAKGGVISFTKALAKEVAKFGIRVNAVAPGFIDTEMMDSLNSADKERHMKSIPHGRFGRPEEVSGVVGFLASKEASYIIGETIIVSGGIP